MKLTINAKKLTLLTTLNEGRKFLYSNSEVKHANIVRAWMKVIMMSKKNIKCSKKETNYYYYDYNY